MTIARRTDRTRAAGALLLPLALLATACDGGDPTGSTDDEPSRLTVDASEGWAFVSLESGGAVSVSDPASSAAWDVAFFATSVMLNGGAAGPAGVEGHCLCRNAGASDAQITAMTPESELAAFQGVTAADVPADDSLWTTDALDPAIDGWYAYDHATHVVSADPGRAWKVRTAEGAAFAKLRVTGIDGATRDHAGRVAFEYAVQPAAGAPMGAVRSDTVDLSAGPVRFDLVDGAVADESDWDLLFDGWEIRVNGGVSGDGQAGAVEAGEPFEQIDDAGDVPARVYRGDAFGGVFAAHPWYRYDIEGNHQVWPTYDVYLIRRGADVYKVQLVGYYGEAGETRRITLRYAPLED